MKTKIINFLKIFIPIVFGVGLIWLFYDALTEEQKTDLFSAFKNANYIWVLISLVFGWLSHLSRAKRQMFLLEPLGFNTKFWNVYHALMIGYLMNLAFPRAGEASRAGILIKTEKIPFEKGFGTILAERAIDVFMLLIVGVVMLALQLDKIDLFQEKIAAFNSSENASGNTLIFTILGEVVKWLIIGGVVIGAVLFLFKSNIRKKIIKMVKGVFQGVFAILKSDNKLSFIGHTLFIWMMYIAMFSVCFYALDATSVLGIDAMLAGFVAGTIGMIMVQGGIGVYPAFVGLIITIYLPNSNIGISPEALALGWIIWTSQTLMMIILGLVSLVLNSRNLKLINA